MGGGCSQPAVAEVAILTGHCAVGSHWCVSVVPLLCRLAAVLPVAIGKMSATLCHSGPMHSRNSAQGGSEEVTGRGHVVGTLLLRRLQFQCTETVGLGVGAEAGVSPSGTGSVQCRNPHAVLGKSPMISNCCCLAAVLFEYNKILSI